jgi:hypothetical protein
MILIESPCKNFDRWSQNMMTGTRELVQRNKPKTDRPRQLFATVVEVVRGSAYLVLSIAFLAWETSDLGDVGVSIVT